MIAIIEASQAYLYRCCVMPRACEGEACMAWRAETQSEPQLKQERWKNPATAMWETRTVEVQVPVPTSRGSCGLVPRETVTAIARSPVFADSKGNLKFC